MYVRISLPLKMASNNGNVKFPANRQVQEAFRGLGYSLMPRLKENQELETEYKLEKIATTGTSVPVNSTLHYRDLAFKNCKSQPDSPFEKEIKSSSIFFGATEQGRTLILVSRVVDGEISVMFYNDSVRRALESLEVALEKIAKLSFVDDSRLADRKVEFHTRKAGLYALKGYLTRKSLWRSASRNRVEIAVASLSLMVFFGAFFVDYLFPATMFTPGSVDPLPSTLRNFVQQTWPAALVAFFTSITIFALHHFFVPQLFIRWEK